MIQQSKVGTIMFEEDDIVKYRGKYRIVKVVRSVGVYFKDCKDTDNPSLGNLQEVKTLSICDMWELLDNKDEYLRILDASKVAIERLYG